MTWQRIGTRREHRWSSRHISDYLDDGLTAADRQRLRRHADRCPECGPLLRSLLRLVGALRALRPPAHTNVVSEILERLRSED
jgi:anti-sigma factor RsiW